MNDSYSILEYLVEKLPIGVIVFDSEGNIITHNSRALSFLAIDIEDTLTISIVDLVKNESLNRMIKEFLDKKLTEGRFQIENRGKLLNCSLQQDQTGNECILILEDATELKKLEGVKQEFVQTILHKIRSPLATLKTSLSILNTELHEEVSEDAAEVLSMCYHEISRLDSILGGLRDLFYVETGLAFKEIDIEKIPVAKAIAKSVTLLESSGILDEHKKRRLKINGNTNLVVKADFEKFIKIISSLLENSFIYSPDNFDVELTVTSHDKIIAIEVRDRGIGISDKMKSFVFTKFFREDNEMTRSIDGNGLSLYLAKAWIDLMDGSISCDTAKEKGTTITLNLPEA